MDWNCTSQNYSCENFITFLYEEFIARRLTSCINFIYNYVVLHNINNVV
jgi:hypothetical protein